MAAVVQQNELVFEFASNVMEDEQQLGDPSIFPAVIVEHVPSAELLHNYSGLTCVDEPSDMITENSLDVAEEQIIEDDDITLTGFSNCCQKLKIFNPCNRWCPRVSGILWSQTSTVLFPSSTLVQEIWSSLKPKSLEIVSCHFAEMIAVKEMITNYQFHSLHPVHAVDFHRREGESMQDEPGPAL